MINKIWQHKNIKESFLCAVKGLKIVLRLERNAKIILIAGITVSIAGLFLNLTANEFSILIIVMVGVFICEIFNTLIEKTLDTIQPQYDPKIKTLKDISSSAVLLSVLGAITIGIIIFLPKIFNLLR